MPRRSSRPVHKPRELRRRVIVPARLCNASGWSDASIVNISSRGLLIHTARPLERGSQVELRRGDHIITARVVWRDGAKAGLQADERVPVEELASGEIGKALNPPGCEQRRTPRTAEESRHRGRTFEFAGVLGVLVMMAVATVALVEQALARPMAIVAAALR